MAVVGASEKQIVNLYILVKGEEDTLWKESSIIPILGKSKKRNGNNRAFVYVSRGIMFGQHGVCNSSRA